ncbi:MAG: DUF167 domain-containing protein [Phycisphaerae bacterium]|nr:DUF167 domain-containing protein [Phycisphaerae bacterium]
MIRSGSEQSDSPALLTVKVVPGSSRTQVAGKLGDMIKIKIAAPPEKGKANECLIDFLSETLGCRRHDIQLVRGQSQPVKQLQIAGLSLETIRQRLGLPNAD